MSSAELISGLERCPRIPYWSGQWKVRKLKPAEMIDHGVRTGIMEPYRTDYGELAGETVYASGSDPGLDSKEYDLHSEVVHLACLADVVTTAIRKPGSEPWKLAAPVGDWESGCFMSPDGTHLRRVAYVTSWSEDRHMALCRQWETLGEVCMHNLPMHLIVVMLGRHLDGRYHSYWSHALRHPANKKLRFRKRHKVEEPFKESWIEVWRADYNDITTVEWLDGMLADDVLRDVLFRLDVPVPSREMRQKIVDLAESKLEMIASAKELPQQNLSTCDFPIRCRFLEPCHSQQLPSPAYGFVRIQS